MGNFNKRGGGDGDRGGFHGGGRDFGHQNFNKKMFRATCADCGNSCEVPFAPTGGKPVYCKECFSKKGGRDGGDRFQKNDFRPHSFSPNGFEGGRSNGNDDVRRQIENLSSKIERLIEKIDALTRIKLSQEKEATVVVAEAKRDNKAEIEKNKPELKKLVTKAVKKEPVAKAKKKAKK